eukprot:CAMPEP_0114118524 /NCGR_PEP_ID=MMETSP0043_2-20121206/5626_1 /TAXON_ID=464988 /ORGANISM="Hemiselmis andersenii, Strain CCMP644" /LENGTH=151 /DNA_ID=CAMNT_0001211015 /DNA_START=43 /DNA_END=495 /DNA_ORIENTATION=+
MQRLGVGCDVFDLAPALARADTDEGIVLPSNATKILSDLGMSHTLRGATKLETWDIFGSDDKRIGGADLAAVSAEGDFLSLRSTELIKALLKECSRDASGAAIRMAAGVVGIEVNAAEGVNVNFKGGSLPPRSYDVVVGADGVGSKVRELG